jgi:hypothetical protein
MSASDRWVRCAMFKSRTVDRINLKIAVRRIGPAAVFERLWEKTRCRAVIRTRRHPDDKFALERAVFLAVLHRLFVRGSDRGGQSVARRRRRRETRSASPLSSHGVAVRGAAGKGAGRPHAVRPRVACRFGRRSRPCITI